MNASHSFEALETTIDELLSPSGFHALGWFRIENGQPAVLIGNIGGSHWRIFSNSEESVDGLADPMDRWTDSVMQAAARKLGCDIRFPFGDPIWPFQHYAAAIGMRASPIGLFIHPQFGLWVAFRGALIFDLTIDIPDADCGSHPCLSCVQKPCLSTCPVGAFGQDGFNVGACRSHVSNDPDQVCRQGGCLARLSCPVGSQYHYEKPHQAFHMQAFSPD